MSIAFFPDFAPEQLFVDGCARYHDLMNYPTKGKALKTLLGNRARSLEYDFPRYLTSFCENLPTGHLYNENYLVDHHTLLPFWIPFASIEKILAVYENMKFGFGTPARRQLGISRFEVTLPKFFKYCELCVVEDRNLHGYCFWRRVHQLPSVHVCPIHGVWLSISPVPVQHFDHLISAEISVDVPKEPISLNLSLTSSKAALKIAQDAQWLLEHQYFMGSAKLTQNLKMRISDAGFGSFEHIHSKKFCAAIREFFTDETFHVLDCRPPNVENGEWVETILRADHTIYPVYCLLILQFLGVSISTFLSAPSLPEAMGNGPWSCYNPVASHAYKAKTIKTYAIQTIQMKNRKTLTTVAVFKCKCGFMYYLPLRMAPPEGDLAHKYVISYGDKWDRAFTAAWNSHDISFWGLNYRFKIGRKAAEVHAQYLQLPARPLVANPTETEYVGKLKTELRTFWQEIISQNPTLIRYELHKRYSREFSAMDRYDKDWFNQILPPPTHQMRKKTVAAGTSLAERKEQTRQEHRQTFLNAQKQNPNMTPKDFYADSPTLYKWFQKCDQQWYLDHMVHRNSRKNGGSHTDDFLASMDEMIADLLPSVALVIKNNEANKRYVARHTLLSEIGMYNFVQNFKDHLPKTMSKIDELVETKHDFAIRRIKRATDYFFNKGEMPTKQLLKTKAGVHEYNEDTSIQLALNEALKWLQEELKQDYIK